MALGFLDFSLPKPDFLNFGRSSTVIPDNELSFSVTMPAPVGTFQFYAGIRFTQTASSPWQTAFTTARPVTVADAEGVLLSETRSILQAEGKPTPIGISGIWGEGTPRIEETSVRWSEADSLRDTRAVRYTEGQRYSYAMHGPWQQGIPYGSNPTIPWHQGILYIREPTGPWHQGIPYRRDPIIPWKQGYFRICDPYIVWEQAMPPPRGWRRIPYDNPLKDKHWGRLNFACFKPGRLNFGNTCFGSSDLLIRIQRSYRVINSAALIRVSDGADIPVSSLTVGLDWEAWCWTLSATLLNRIGYETVPVAPGLVQATINGFVWQFIPDDVNYSRTFGQFGGQLTGRSRVSELAAPFTLSRSYQENGLRTGEQLALQELADGYSLDWQLPAWTVPGGTYQYQNLTPMESILRIAQSTGGRVYPDPILKTLHAVPKWPVNPWGWTLFVPDATLPSSYTLKEALQNRAGTEYEAVMISGGVAGGIVAMVKRAGTAGGTFAPAVVDTLITDLEPATARAVQALADAWPMKRYTLELPLQARPAGAGLILPGTTLDFSDGETDGWRGMVVSVSISAGRDSITQTLELISV